MAPWNNSYNSGGGSSANDAKKRKLAIWLAIGIIVIALVVGLLIWQPWKHDDEETNTPSLWQQQQEDTHSPNAVGLARLLNATAGGRRATASRSGGSGRRVKRSSKRSAAAARRAGATSSRSSRSKTRTRGTSKAGAKRKAKAKASKTQRAKRSKGYRATTF